MHRGMSKSPLRASQAVGKHHCVADCRNAEPAAFAAHSGMVDAKHVPMSETSAGGWFGIGIHESELRRSCYTRTLTHHFEI